jgi:hypothetical protein
MSRLIAVLCMFTCWHLFLMYTTIFKVERLASKANLRPQTSHGQVLCVVLVPAICLPLLSAGTGSGKGSRRRWMRGSCPPLYFRFLFPTYCFRGFTFNHSGK